MGRKLTRTGPVVADTTTTWFGSPTHLAPPTDKIPGCARIH
ncbi:hypothetical protein YT1_p20006 (plasmid) [Rhodococcus ruber]|nr:hypothetical protein YT1_p20006 [Rhodococcus ruber]